MSNKNIKYTYSRSTQDSRPIWEGVYDSFEEATHELEKYRVLQGNTAFNHPAWLDKQKEHAQGVLKQMDSEIDTNISLTAQTRDYWLPVIAATMKKSNSEISILDFGGGIAVTYLMMEKMFTESTDLQYYIIESERICDASRDILKSRNNVHFLYNLPKKDNKFDIIHSGAAFHYVDDWKDVIKEFSEYKAEYLIFSDIPVGDIETFVTIQNYYEIKVPVRFWNFIEFVSEVESHGYKLLLKSRYDNKYIKEREVFEDKYRLTYTSQLIFRKLLDDKL